MKVTQLASLVCNGVVCGLLALVAAPASAATIEIGFTGLNLSYDGSSIFDSTSIDGGTGDPLDADSISSIDFSIDGVPIGSLSGDLAADVLIPDVIDIPAGANVVHNQVTPGSPGYFDLLIGATASEFLLVDLEEVSVTYVDVQNIVQFTFGAAIGEVFSQNLPFGLAIGDEVTVSFSAQLIADTKTSSGGFITGFNAFGGGEIRGQQVPEPGTCMLAALGLATTLVGRFRK